ncbi:MAG: hypothetical protein D6719_11250 [Candidatus Dadabacteria bacterium]|nr:MAG: hypothetical protein D6719_11250 [Candidatus Dadabacteria bacterium]
MKLYKTSGLPTLPVEAVVKKQPLIRLVTGFFLLAVLLLLVGAIAVLCLPMFSEWLPSELKGWGRYPLIAGVLLFTVLFAVILRSFFRASNWLLKVTPDSLLIKFRSDYNAQLPEPHPTVLELNYSEIDWARYAREWVRQPGLSSSSSAYYRAHYLELKLNLDNQAKEALSEALKKEINFSSRDAGGKTVFNHYPVRFENSILRVQWWAGLRPRITSLLEILKFKVPTEFPVEIEKDLSQITPGEVEKTVQELVSKGDKLRALSLARRHFGFSLAEAKEWVESIS